MMILFQWIAIETTGALLQWNSNFVSIAIETMTGNTFIDYMV